MKLQLAQVIFGYRSVLLLEWVSGYVISSFGPSNGVAAACIFSL
jgi:hypothetical protein